MLAKFADIGLESFIKRNVLWEGDHIRLVLTKKDSKGVSSPIVYIPVNLRFSTAHVCFCITKLTCILMLRFISTS